MTQRHVRPGDEIFIEGWYRPITDVCKFVGSDILFFEVGEETRWMYVTEAIDKKIIMLKGD